MIKLLVHSALILTLTLVTQVGGFAYLMVLLVRRYLEGARVLSRGTGVVLFLGSYAVLSLLAAAVAPVFGRTPLPCFASADVPLAMQSPIFCALNRHYVTPELKEVALELSSHVDRTFPGTVTLVLDGNFPFVDGFPMLPHLSHSDGRKLDLAFYYRAAEGGYVRGGTKSPVGYWAFEEPRENSELPCAGRSEAMTLRWDMAWFRPFLNDYTLDRERTRAALDWLINSGRKIGVVKILVEPHLAAELNVRSEILRFQGCRAARHDDHIHIEVER
jgi:hypothetical protein